MICYIHNVIKRNNRCPMCEAEQTEPPPPASSSGDLAYRSALSLAMALWRRHYQKEAPHWKPQPDVVGLISQIDNMAAGLSNRLDDMKATVQPNEGQIIINAIIRAGAILTIEKTSEDSAIIVWHANAAEQIEAALSEAGFTISQNQQS
jgi:hypothetical protein